MGKGVVCVGRGDGGVHCLRIFDSLISPQKLTHYAAAGAKVLTELISREGFTFQSF